MSGRGAEGAPSTSGAAATSSTGGSSKADAIWQQLKSAHAAPKAQNINFNKLWHGFSSDSASGGANKAARVTTQQTYDSQLVSRPRPSAGTDPATQQQPSLVHQPQSGPQSSASTSFKPDPDTALQLVTRCVAGLKDSSQAARRKALQDVQAQILDNPSLSEQWLAERLEADGLGKALLRRFDDPPDSCREMAVTCLLRLLQAAPQAVLSLLPYAFPVLAERVRHKEEGSKNLTEPCEEVRLALARLLRALVVLGGKSFGGYAGEAVELVAALCEDPFHEVQEEACAVVVAMNAVLGLRLQPISKQLVAALLPLTTAKRHRVRIAALQALRPTMHQGAHEMILEMVAWRDPNVIPIKAFYGDDLKVNFCGKLAADPHPAVRREFLAVVGDWMTGLRERMDHESRLLPFVLSALNDEAPEIQADAVALLERLGQQYEADHEKDLKDTLAYLPEEAHGIGWQAPGAAGYVYGTAADGEETVNGGRAVFVLPGPLRCRPRLGTRRLVQSNLSRIVGALSEEVTSWLLDARRRAAALLRTQLVLSEEWSEQHLHLIMPALCKAISDPEVRSSIRDCAAVVGAFTDPELALQLLQPRLADEAADAAHRAAALEVLACVVRGAGPRRALDAHLPALLDLVCLESLLCSEDSRVRRALQEVVEQLVATCGPACGRHTARLLWACLHLRSPGRTAQPLPATAAGAMTASSAAPATAAGVPPSAGTASVAAGVLLPEAGVGPAVAAAGGDGTGAFVEAVLLPRLAEVCGYSGGVDEMVEAHRRELLAQLQPGSSPNVLLATGVLCRLMLPRASLSYLLYVPDDVAARVLPPVEPGGGGSTAGTADMEVDVDGTGTASGGPAAATVAEQEAASPSGRPPCGLWWQPGSTTAVLTHLAGDLASWLPGQPRCAAMVVLCLEACLTFTPASPVRAALPGSGGSGGGASSAEVTADAADPDGKSLLGVLCQALQACQELPAGALLGALRCVHVALRRGLAPGVVLVQQLQPLVQRLAGCMAVVSAAVCRLQACYVLQMLIGVPEVVATLRAQVDVGGAGGDVTEAGTAAFQAVCSATSSRLYDAADEVRCAALGVAKEVVQVALVPGSGVLAGGDCVERLVEEIAQLRDVAPGSEFWEQHRAFRAWAEHIVPKAGRRAMDES